MPRANTAAEKRRRAAAAEKERLARERAEAEKREKNAEYMRQRRGTRDAKDKENMEKIFRRIKEGKRPKDKVLERYGITYAEVNALRKSVGLQPLTPGVIHFMQARERMIAQTTNPDAADDGNDSDGSAVLGRGDQEYDFFPQEAQDNLDDVGRNVLRNQAIEAIREAQREQRQAVEATERALDAQRQQIRQDASRPQGYSVEQIATWQLNHPPRASAKSAAPKAAKTLKSAYGRLDANGKWSGTGNLNLFMTILGDEYVRDVRKAVKNPDLLVKTALRKDIRKRHSSGNVTSDGEFVKVATLLHYYMTVLTMLREYPLFNATNAFADYPNEYRQYEPYYKELAKKYHMINAQANAEAQVKVKKDVFAYPLLLESAREYFPPVRGVYTPELLYVSMYDEVSLRGDYNNLLVDTTTRRIPTPDDYDWVKRNTLFLRPDGRAIFILVTYKTAKIYGKRYFEFSKSLSREIIKYWDANKDGKRYLFDGIDITTMIRKFLLKIEVPEDVIKTEGVLKYLRKSKISTELQNNPNMTPLEREAMAYDMAHSVTASVKYIRNVLEKEDKEKNVRRVGDISKKDPSVLDQLSKIQDE